MLRISFGPLLAASVLVAQPLAAKPAPPPPPTPLIPQGKWSVEYAANMCVLSRMFSDGKTSVQLSLKPSPNSDQARLMLIEKGKRRAPLSGAADVRLSDGSRPDRAQGRTAWKEGIALTSIDLKRSALAPLDSPQGSIIVRFGKATNYHIAPGGMKSAWKALATCERDLLKSWGMDEAAQDRLARMPVGKPGWFTARDYPARLVEQGVQGSVGAVVSVGADGRVTNCRAAEPSGTAELDSKTCEVMTKRAVFDPALDRDGKPMAALVFYRVNWLIEDSWEFSPGSDAPGAPFAPPMSMGDR